MMPAEACTVLHVSSADLCHHRAQFRNGVGWWRVCFVFGRRWWDGGLLPGYGNEITLQQRFVELNGDDLVALVVLAASDGRPRHSAASLVVKGHQACGQAATDGLLQAWM